MDHKMEGLKVLNPLGIILVSELRLPSLVIEACQPQTPPVEPKHIPNHKEPPSKMSSSRNLEEVAEQALKEKAEVEARVKYLQAQLSQLMREKQRNLRDSPSSIVNQAKRRKRASWRIIPLVLLVTLLVVKEGQCGDSEKLTKILRLTFPSLKAN